MTEEQMKLVQDNIRFPYYMVNKYFSNVSNLPASADKEDLYQVACVAMAKAAKKYEVNKGKFTNFAGLVIMNDIRMFLRYNAIDSSYGGRNKYYIDSLDEPVGTDKDGNVAVRAEFIPSDVDVAQDIVDEQHTAKAFKIFWGNLSDRDKRILSLKAAGLRQDQICVKIGLSQSYVSRIIIALREKLKVHLAKGEYK